MTRCPYRYVSLTSNNFSDNQCTLEENHIGEHIKKEMYAPYQQPYRLQEGWIKPQTTKEANG